MFRRSQARCFPCRVWDCALSEWPTMVLLIFLPFMMQLVAADDAVCPPGYTQHGGGYWANPCPDWHTHPIDAQNATVKKETQPPLTVSHIIHPFVHPSVYHSIHASTHLHNDRFISHPLKTHHTFTATGATVCCKV